jgi:hypothetical protein
MAALLVRRGSQARRGLQATPAALDEGNAQSAMVLRTGSICAFSSR